MESDSSEEIFQSPEHTTPISVGRKLQFRLVKKKMEGKFLKSFHLHFEEDGIINRETVLIARRKLGSAYPQYDIYHQQKVVGQVRSFALGTGFSIYSLDGHKREVGCVQYEPNLLGHNGPRRIAVLVPCMTPEKRFVDLDPSKSLIQHLKEQSQLVLQLQNKLPQWSDETQSYVLNFNGRVSLASVKNFQIVHPNDLEHVVLQFGKVTQNEFSVDIQYPFSILLGFGIVLTAFESKVACE